MKVYGVLVVQNEEDVIEDTLEFLKNLNIFEMIFLYDLGSEDDTFMKAKKFEEIVYEPQILDEIYTEKLRYDLMIKHRNFYKEGDWVAIIDSDEFYFDNPIGFINLAEKENATCLKTYQADFMFTHSDLRNFDREDLGLPIYERRKHYLISWSEIRFFKYLPAHGFFTDSKPCSHRFLNRHYPFRTPEQIKTRIKTRLETKRRSQNLLGKAEWLQVYSSDWRDYVVADKILHEHTGGEFKFGIPECTEWKDYYSQNPFSTLLPQVAEAFAEEQELLRSSLNNQQSHMHKKEMYEFGIGSIAFEDCYSLLVLSEIKKNIKTRKWKAFVQGLKVFLKYNFDGLMKSMYTSLEHRLIHTKNKVLNIAINMKRLLSLKSTGLIWADPNPIRLNDGSDLGVTTLSWKSIGTQEVEIRIGAPDGRLLFRKGSAGAESTGKLVHNGMVFFLQDGSNEMALNSDNTLARVKVLIKNGGKISI